MTEPILQYLPWGMDHVPNAGAYWFRDTGGLGCTSLCVIVHVAIFVCGRDVSLLSVLQSVL